MDALRFDHLRLGYGRGPDLVTDASLAVAAGSTVAILGPSGGGKTTLLKAVAGLVTPRAGHLEVLGHVHPERPAPGRIGYIPQRLGLVRHTSVLDNVLHGGLHRTPWHMSLRHRVPTAIENEGHAVLERLGLGQKTHSPVHRLSGGQQRRVAIARSLVQAPELLLADEFLGELDPATMRTVTDAVQEQQAKTGMTLVIVEHQLEQALQLADAVYRLKGGRLELLEDTA